MMLIPDRLAIEPTAEQLNPHVGGGTEQPLPIKDQG